MTDDSALLRRYAEEGSEEAFAALVRRHLGLVHAAAVRQTGDPHRAQEVAQSVFNDLARKAPALAGRPVLAGWLYTGVRHAAAKLRRAERRRGLREQEAVRRHELMTAAPGSAEWERVRPVLDDAMHALGEDDRTAVLLRFFEAQSHAEIGAALGLGEDAARKRVERALERLRARLAGRGVTSTAAALAAALASQPAAAVPAGLAAATTAGALAATGGGGTVFLLKIMSMTKLHFGLAAAVLAAAGTTGYVLQRTNARLRDQVAALQERETTAAAGSARAGAQLAALGAANDAAQAELGRLRGQVAALERRLAAPPEAPAIVSPAGNTPAAAAPAPAMVPVDAMHNVGRATPRAAGQTEAWAMQRGDIDTVASLLAFAPADRARLEALAAALPENLREQYGTPERLMALVLTGTPRPIAAVQVLDEEPQGADDYVQHIELKYGDGRVRADTLQFHRTDEGWQRVVSSEVVDRVVRALKNGPPPVPAAR